MAFNLCRRPLWRGRSLLHRLGAGALAVVFVLQPLLAAAQEARRAVLVVDGNTGRTLYQSGADARRHPASLTKLMTLYLLFELLEQGQITLASKIRFSANAADATPSRLGVEEGTEITVADAIKALIVKSANDVAIAVAEHIGGSEQRFAQLMNRKAEELGMKHTEFHNASGLPHPEQVTTARDMMTLALALHDRFPRQYRLFATRTFDWNGESYRNHNTLLFSYRGLEGLKTGYIRASGFNLVAAARRGKKHVFVAYFGGKTATLRNVAVRAHLDAGFTKASVAKTRLSAPVVTGKAKGAPGGEAVGASAEVISPPQPVVRKAAHGVEIARVRPVRAKVDTRVKATTQAEAVASHDGAAAVTVVSAGSVPKGAFHVQIGAFQTRAEAERQLASVSEKAGPVVGTHAAHMMQVKVGAKTYFRARYVGFAGRSAASFVCSELKRMEIDCLVMKAE